uniref:BESS domain-containing protein n=1 Tax=Toxocara canis TaxID=6265 RepID=A0A183U7P8_TOXCA
LRTDSDVVAIDSVKLATATFFGDRTSEETVSEGTPSAISHASLRIKKLQRGNHGRQYASEAFEPGFNQQVFITMSSLLYRLLKISSPPLLRGMQSGLEGSLAEMDKLRQVEIVS